MYETVRNMCKLAEERSEPRTKKISHFILSKLQLSNLLILKEHSFSNCSPAYLWAARWLIFGVHFNPKLSSTASRRHTDVGRTSLAMLGVIPSSCLLHTFRLRSSRWTRLDEPDKCHPGSWRSASLPAVCLICSLTDETVHGSYVFILRLCTAHH